MFIIYGAGGYGRAALRFLGSENVRVFCDSNEQLRGTFVEGKEIVLPNELKNDSFESDEIVIACRAYDEIAVQLREIGITKYYCFYPDEGKMKQISDEGGIVDYFQIRIIDHCNLNCYGCGAVCNSKTKQHFYSKSCIEKDLINLHKVMPYVGRIKILGGEPFMHPELAEICRIVKSIYTDTEVEIATNGLLLMRVDDELLQQIKRYDVVIHITEYDPIIKIKDSIYERLDRFGIRYIHFRCNQFYKGRTLVYNDNIDEIFKNCLAKNCMDLREGILCMCSASEGFQQLNDLFGTEYRIIDGVDYINIRNGGYDIHDFLKRSKKPNHICGYCRSNPYEWFEWHLSNREPELSDYVCSENDENA